MKTETKNKWSVIINIILTTITALLSALGFSFEPGRGIVYLGEVYDQFSLRRVYPKSIYIFG